jgi:hypothetical protein
LPEISGNRTTFFVSGCFQASGMNLKFLSVFAAGSMLDLQIQKPHWKQAVAGLPGIPKRASEAAPKAGGGRNRREAPAIAGNNSIFERHQAVKTILILTYGDGLGNP